MRQAERVVSRAGGRDGAGWDGAERRRVEAIVETLAGVRGRGEDLSEVAHDARNMVTALGLYCDLLDEPGVLAAPFLHYGSELRLVAAASRRLVEKLVALDAHGLPHAQTNPQTNQGTTDDLSPADIAAAALDLGKRTVRSETEERKRPAQRWDLLPALPIENLAAELLANRNLLAALAGPTIPLTVTTEGGARPVPFTGEDLTRVLVNLVKNAAEAMPGGGTIQIHLTERPAGAAGTQSLLLRIEDSGPGIPPKMLERVFEAGFSTQTSSFDGTGWPATHRGLGLSITRSIIEAAGGHVHAENRSPSGARFEIELPTRTR